MSQLYITGNSSARRDQQYQDGNIYAHPTDAGDCVQHYHSFAPRWR